MKKDLSLHEPSERRGESHTSCEDGGPPHSGQLSTEGSTCSPGHSSSKSPGREAHYFPPPEHPN
jgi:hypothetical protein